MLVGMDSNYMISIVSRKKQVPNCTQESLTVKLFSFGSEQILSVFAQNENY